MKAVTMPAATNKLTPKRWTVLLGLICLVLAACNREDAEAASAPVAASAETTQTTRAVRTVTASEGSLNAQKSATVTIEPLQESSVAAGATGRVEQILKREGQTVEAGETVLVLDQTNARSGVQNAQLALEAARINLQKASRATGEGTGQLELQVQSAQANYNVLSQQYLESEALFAAGGIAKTQLDNLAAQLSSAEASLVQLQNALAQNQRAGGEDLSLLNVQVSQAETALNQAQEALAETSIKAPFAGEIADILTEQGEFLAAGSPAFRLVSSDTQLGRFSVPPEDAAALLAQGEVFFRYQGLDYGATIIRSSTAPNNQRLVDITAEIYPSDTRIPAGAVAQLRYETSAGQGVLVPSSAIIAEAGTNYVYLAQDGLATRQPVRVLQEVSGQAAVEGLDAGRTRYLPAAERFT